MADINSEQVAGLLRNPQLWNKDPAEGVIGVQGLNGQAVRLPVDKQYHPKPEHLRWHDADVFKGQA